MVLEDRMIEKAVKGGKLISGQLFYVPTLPGEEPTLIGSRCNSCELVFFPKRVVCLACMKDDTMEEILLNRKGRLHSFTISYVALPGFPTPNIQGFVDLPEGPRVFSQITGCQPKGEDLEIGMEVELTIEPLCKDDKGHEVIGFKFRPVIS